MVIYLCFSRKKLIFQIKHLTIATTTLQSTSIVNTLLIRMSSLTINTDITIMKSSMETPFEMDCLGPFGKNMVKTQQKTPIVMDTIKTTMETPFEMDFLGPFGKKPTKNLWLGN